MDISVTTIEMADTTIVGNGDLTLSSNIENGTGPSANSPLIGGYLLIIIDEPHSQEHKDLILQKVAKGLLSWNKEQNLVNLEKELDIITTKAADGEVSRLNERLIQYASENLVTEILINATSNTVLQCIRNLLSSFTRHRHIIHAGYTFAGSGSWILQDGTFSYADMCDALQDTEVQRVFEAYENIVTIDIHCSSEGEWPKLDHEQFVRICKLKTNPTDVLTAGTPSITNFMKYIEPYVIPMETDTLLESSDVVGNIRFSHPTLYIFPGGQGDSALFGINGFNMLIDGGFARKACFWDFTRHLDRLDAVLITRINNNNINGITAVLEKKRNQQCYPQIGHVFCNLQDRKKLLSPSEDKEKDPLVIDLIERSQQLVNCLRHINLRPQSCFRDTEPINLYHKVGHGSLNMYVLSPAKESREVREFMDKWNANDNKVFITRKDSKELIFPIQNMISICALLIWEPAKPNENITRILFPGSTPQHKIFEGLDKLKHLEFFRTPVCSANTIVPSKSLTAITKMTKPVKSLDKVIQNDNIKPLKLATDIKKEKPSPPIIDNKQRSEKAALDDNKTKSIVADNKTKSTVASTIKYPKKTLKTNIKKSESVESDKDEVKTDEIKTKETDSETESKKLDEDKKVTKDDQKSSLSKTRSKSKASKSIERKPRTEIKSDTKPSTPKKVASEQQGMSNKFQAKSSPSATPAKSAKDANNRKVVESKYKSLYSKKESTKPVEKDQPPKVERKPISRRPKPPSPMRKLGGSPVKSLKLNKNEKDIRKKAEKSDTVDSSTVSTPVDIDSTKLANDVKLSETEIELLKAQELADLKEEQEVIKEIEAVFSKDEQNKKTEVESVAIAERSIPDEVDEYLIIEKEEFVEISQDALADNGKTETTEISEEPEEKLEEIKQDIEPVAQAPSRPTEFTTPITSTPKSKPISLESCNKIENEINEIIQSAADIAKTKEEGQSYDNDKKEKVEEISRDVSITSPEEKLELSSEKKTTDTKDIDEVENKEADQNYVVESQPDEKFSATSGATTAPTLPEDERITLDEIKEDKVPDIEEKYVNEETKEKDLPISIEPIRFEPKPKENDVRAMQYEAQQAHLRDIVKTPDEVADLPVHEEVDGGPYDHGHVEEQAEKEKQDVDELKVEETQEKDVKLDDDAKEKVEEDQPQVEEIQEKDVKLGVDDKEKVEELGETEEKAVKLVGDVGDKEKDVEDQLKVEETQKKITDEIGDKEKSDVENLKKDETKEKGDKLDEDIDDKEKSKDQIPQKLDDGILEKDIIEEKILPEKLENVEVKMDVIQTEKLKEDALDEKDIEIDVVKTKQEIDIESKKPVDSELESSTKHEDSQVGETTDIVDAETVHVEDSNIITDEKVLSEINVEKEVCVRKIDEKVTGETSVDIKTSKVDTDKQDEVEISELDPGKVDKKLDDEIEDVSIKKEGIEQSKVEVSKIEEKVSEIEKEKLDMSEKISTEKVDDIYKAKDNLDSSKESVLNDSSSHDPVPSDDFKVNGATETAILPETTSILRNLDEEKDDEADQLYAMKETWIRDNNNELGELRYSGVPTEFKEPFSSLPYTVNEYTTELRETHITTLDSPAKPIEELESTILNNNKQSKLSTLLENSKELMESTSKIISDIKAKDTLKSEEPPSSTLGIDVVKLVANVAEVLKSDKSLEEIASTIKEQDIVQKQDEDVITASTNTFDNESIKKSISPEPEKDETIPSEKCIKESILNFLNEERKAFDEVEDLEVNGDLEEEKDYDTEKQTQKIDEDVEISKISTQPIRKVDVLDSEVSLPLIKDEKLSEDPSSTLDKSEIEQKVVVEQKEKSPPIIPETLERALADKDSISIEKTFDADSISETSVKRKSIADSEISKSPTPEKSIMDVKAVVIEKQDLAGLEVKEKSKSPDMEILKDEIEKRKSITLEKSRSATPERPVNDKKDSSETPDKRKSIDGSETKESSKSPTPEKSIIDVKILNEEVEKQRLIEKFEDLEISKSPILDKAATEETEKRKSIEDSKALEKSRSSTPDGSALDHSSESADKRKSIQESETKETSKSPTPEKYDAKDTAKSKSPTPEKSIIDIKATTEEAEKRKSIEVCEKSKSSTPERTILDQKDSSETLEKRISIDASETKEISKSPTPERSIKEVEVKRESITLDKSKSSSPEKIIIDEKDTSEESEKIQSIVETAPQDLSKAPEKSDSKEKSTPEVDEKLPSTGESMILESKFPTPEESKIDESDATDEVANQKSVIESATDKHSKSASPEKTRSSLEGKSKSPSPAKSVCEKSTKEATFEMKEESETSSKSVVHDQSKSPTPEKGDTKEKEPTELGEKRQSLGESAVQESIKSKSPTPEKDDAKEKITTELDEKRQSIGESAIQESLKSKSPSPEKDDAKEKITTELDDRRQSIGESVVQESLKSKSPSPEKDDDNEKVTTELDDKRQSIGESVVQESLKSKSPTPEKDDDKEKVTTELDDKRQSIGESAVQESIKSKSPTPEKDEAKEKEPTELGEKRQSIEESAIQESLKSKSSSPEKDDAKEKTTSELDEKRQSIGESVVQELIKSKSPTPEKDDRKEKLTTELDEKHQSIGESAIQKLSKSPTPEKDDSKEKVTTELDDKHQSIGESAVQESLKSKSPTPEKDDDKEKVTTELDDKRQSIGEFGIQELSKSKSPTPEKDDKKEKDDTKETEPTVLDEKRQSIGESAIQETLKSKSLTPEKDDAKEKVTTELDEKHQPIGQTEVQESLKSKSPTPEKDDAKEKLKPELDEKHQSIGESVVQESLKSKSPTPEKDDEKEKVTTELDDKRQSIGESAVQELSKSKSPTPEKDDAKEKVKTELDDKRQSIGGSVVQESLKSKSPTPEKDDAKEKEITKLDEKRQSIEESAVQGSLKSKSPTPEKGDTKEKEPTELGEKSQSLGESIIQDSLKSKSPTPEKDDAKEKITTELDEKRQSIGESAIQESLKSKSPSPEKDDAKEKITTELDGKRQSIGESVVQESLKSKSPTPEKDDDKGKVRTELDDKRQSIGESVVQESLKSKSPPPEKDDDKGKVRTELDDKRQSIGESVVQESLKSKSPTPEKDDDKGKVRTELDDKRQSIGESVVQESLKSKSPPPEKDDDKGKVRTELDDKRQSIGESVVQESLKSKSPTPEKDDDKGKVRTELDDKRQSIGESVVQESLKSKSPTPEKDDDKEKVTTELDDKRQSIGESAVQESIKSKSPTPEKDEAKEKVTTELDEKRQSIGESADQGSLKSKSPTPEKDDAKEKVTTELDEKRQSIGETVVQELSKSPTPEKRKSIVDSIGHDQTKSPTPEKSDSEEKASAIQELSKSKSPTPEKPIEDRKDSLETPDKRKAIDGSETMESTKSPTPDKSIIDEKGISEESEKRKSITESAVHDKSKSPTPEKTDSKENVTSSIEEKRQSVGESTGHESKSPTPEISDSKDKVSTEVDKNLQSLGECTVQDLSKSPTPEKSVIEEKGTSEEQEKSHEQSKSPTPEKISVGVEKVTTETKSPTPEKFAFEEKEKTNESSDVKTAFEETIKHEIIEESIEKSKSSSPEVSADEKNIATDINQDKKTAEESKSPSPDKSIQEEKIISETQEKEFSTIKIVDELKHTEEIEKSSKDLSDSVCCEKSKSPTPEKTIIQETEEKQKLIGLDKQAFVISKTQETTTTSIDKETKFTTVEKSKVTVESDDKVMREESEILTNGHQTTNGFHEEMVDVDKQETFKSKTQTSTSTDSKIHEKSEKQTTYDTKIVTNGVEINMEKSTSSKIVDLNGEGTSDNTAKPIKTDDATISTSYSKTVDTKEIEILHTTNGTSDIQTSEVISAEKTEEISIAEPKTTVHSTIVTNGSSVTESTTKVAQVSDQKERKSLIDEQIPGISVDSPIKSTKKQSETTEDGDIHEEGCLSTENLSPLHLSGRSTPEIKIDLDVDRQMEKELLPLQEVDKPSEDIVVGTSSTKTDIGVASIIKQSMEDISGNLSGKSTPDIAEVEKLKEELKFEKYISKKTTQSPKHTAGTKDSETICVMKASKITTEKHEVLTESTGKVIKEEIITTEEQSIERSPDLKLDKDSQHEITIETSTKTIKTVSEETHDVQTNGKHETYSQSAGGSDKSKVITEPLTLFSKTSEVLYKTSGDMDMGDVSSPPSNLSSGQGSCAPHIWDEHFTDEEDIPDSPLSTTSQIGGSPTSQSQFQYDTGLTEDTILSRQQMDTMSTSFYGSLPEETVIDHSKTEPVLIPKKSDHFGVSSMAEEQTFIELGTGISKHEFLSSDLKSKISVEKDDSKTPSKDLGKSDEKLSDDKLKTTTDKVDKPDTHKDSIESKEEEQKPSSSTKPDAVESWGKPLGLPSPAPPGETKSTPKKERKTAASLLAAKNKKNNERKRSESPGKLNKKITPIYLDLTYVPHHGNANYCYVDFFKKIRARYYVFSGTEPSREVYNALLEAKQTWEDKDLEVTIIPTYDTDVLGYWVAENEELLSKNKIDLSPSASRCTINLQDHETSCSAYRLEF